MPETLTALIASRLDASSPATGRSSRTPRCSGRASRSPASSAVAGHRRGRARAAPARRSSDASCSPSRPTRARPERGQYAFVQALIREVAYNTLARRDRKVRHLAAARFFEALGSDELAGALAGHYLAAYQNAAEGPEADALAAQARIALKAAAERAIGLGSLAQGVGFLDQARAVTRVDAELADLLERAGSAASLAGLEDIAVDRLRQAVDLRRALGDADATAGAIAQLGAVHVTSLRHEAGLALLEPAVDELIGHDLAPTGPGGVALLAQLSRALFFNDDQRRAIEIADRALEAGERLDLAPIVSDVLITRGSALCHLGRAYEGLGAIRAGIELADERGLVSTALRGRLNLGVLATDPRTSFEAAEAALEIARRFGLRGFIRTLVVNAAGAALEIGEWDRAIGEVTAARDDSSEELARNHLSWGLFTFTAWRGGDVSPELDRLATWAESFDESGRGRPSWTCAPRSTSGRATSGPPATNGWTSPRAIP